MEVDFQKSYLALRSYVSYFFVSNVHGMNIFGSEMGSF